MKRSFGFLKSGALLASAVLAAAPGLGSAAPKPPAKVISMARARAIALKTAGGKIKEAELEFENKIWIYSFDLSGKDGKTHEVNVDARTGKVVSSTIETPAAEAKEARQDKAAASTDRDHSK